MKPELIQACLSWAKESNNRSITMHYGGPYGKGRFWLFDYAVGEGVHVEKLKDIPTQEELINKAETYHLESLGGLRA